MELLFYIVTALIFFPDDLKICDTWKLLDSTAP